MKIRKPPYLIQPRGLRARLAMQALTPTLRPKPRRTLARTEPPVFTPYVYQSGVSIVAGKRPLSPEGQARAREEFEQAMMRVALRAHSAMEGRGNG